MADAGTVWNVKVDGAVVIGREDRGDGAHAEGKLPRHAACVVFHTIEESGVLVEEGEENDGEH